jgi:hypothetical protein
MPAHEVLAAVHVIRAVDIDQQTRDVHPRVETDLTDGALDRTRDRTGLSFAAADHCRLRGI